ncbi:beta-lactamase family protein [bacterium]|nr:beta-lactamase family protein [bacterium]
MKQVLRLALGGALILSTVLAVTSCSEEDDNNPVSIKNEAEKIVMEAMLDSIVTLARVPGAALAIRFPDGDEWVTCTGTADLATNRPITESDPFKVGSISKTYTATVVLNLVKTGVIELDEPLATYLPDSIAAYLPVSDVDSVITVRRALNHSSGIVNYVHLPAFLSQYTTDWTYTWTPEELIAFTTDTLYFTPGSGWTYSNTNYIYLGLMVEHLTGHSLAEEIQNVVLDPLGLAHTWFPNTDADLPSGIAQGYYDFNSDSTLEADESITDASPSAAWAAGAVVATPLDLLHWLAALDDGTLLTPELQAQREITIDFTLGGEAYGYGLGIARQAAVAWGHQGGIDGFGAIINRHDEGYDFAVVVNGESPIIAENLANVIYVTAVDKLIGGPAKRLAKSTQPQSAGSDYSTGVSVLRHLRY